MTTQITTDKTTETMTLTLDAICIVKGFNATEKQFSKLSSFTNVQINCTMEEFVNGTSKSSVDILIGYAEEEGTVIVGKKVEITLTKQTPITTTITTTKSKYFVFENQLDKLSNGNWIGRREEEYHIYPSNIKDISREEEFTIIVIPMYINGETITVTPEEFCNMYQSCYPYSYQSKNRESGDTWNDLCYPTDGEGNYENKYKFWKRSESLYKGKSADDDSIVSMNDDGNFKVIKRTQITYSQIVDFIQNN